MLTFDSAAEAKPASGSDVSPGLAETLDAVHDSSLDGLRPAASPQLVKRAEPSTPKIGRFEVLTVLGQGAFGRVYNARDPQLDRFVALKVPAFGPQEKPKIQRFLTEAKSAAKLHHPNIVPTYECGQADGKHFIAAQFVSGQPLSKRLRDNPPDFRQAAEWVRQLASGLAYAHGQGIVHRDIKPDNLLIARSPTGEHLKLTDFGLARVYQASTISGLTMDGEAGGSLPFIPPEQITDFRNVDPRSDIFSTGATLYNLATGKYIHDLPSKVADRMLMILQDEPTDIRLHRPELPEALCKIIHKALARKPRRASNLRYLGSFDQRD